MNQSKLIRKNTHDIGGGDIKPKGLFKNTNSASCKSIIKGNSKIRNKSKIDNSTIEIEKLKMSKNNKYL